MGGGLADPVLTRACCIRPGPCGSLDACALVNAWGNSELLARRPAAAEAQVLDGERGIRGRCA